jgi:hypothetical protein
MNRLALAPEALDRLVKLLGMLGSAHDGEIANAGRKAHALVRQHGMTWADLLTPARAVHWRAKVHACFDHLHVLNEREREFVYTLVNWRGTPTDKQLAWLNRIYENLP